MQQWFIQIQMTEFEPNCRDIKKKTQFCNKKHNNEIKQEIKLLKKEMNEEINIIKINNKNGLSMYKYTFVFSIIAAN